MGNVIKKIIVGFASGAAAAYFLGTEKGKEVVGKVKAGIDDYKDNSESYHQMAKDKVIEYKELATTTFDDYKEKWESGEITTDSLGKSVKDTITQVKDKVFSASTDVLVDESPLAEEVYTEEATIYDEIIIDLTDSESNNAIDA